MSRQAKGEASRADVPIQAVPTPIICSPYKEPELHWRYSKTTGQGEKAPGRRLAKYTYKTKDDAIGQETMTFEEGEDELHIVNALRSDVHRWRKSGYEGATPTTKELLRFWQSEERGRRLFFCQIEAVETVIYLSEILKSGRSPKFKPEFPIGWLPLLADPPGQLPGSFREKEQTVTAFDDVTGRAPLPRMCCKMATGSGKTVVMSMLIAWAFCNRARNRLDERFPSGVLICCPNLTVKDRLQVLRPDRADNYYDAFGIVPGHLRDALNHGRVVVENWHSLAPEEANVEGGKAYAVVDKGAENGEAFARRVLGDLADRGPIMVLNDEAHHCYRPKSVNFDTKKMSVAEKRQAAEDAEAATVWINGLDAIHNAVPGGGIKVCVDLSATPFYIAGSGHVEGSPFPWLVSDFGLLDAIESGIVKIPRIPVADGSGRPEPKYYRLWETVKEGVLENGGKLTSNGKPSPRDAYLYAEAALQILAGQWRERFEQTLTSAGGVADGKVPPVLIVVCDNTEIAQEFYKNISGEEQVEVASAEDVEELEAEEEEEDDQPKGKGKKGKGPKVVTSYGKGRILPELSNTRERTVTVRIDSSAIAAAEAGSGTKAEAGEQLRRVISTVGKRGEPGEHIRCVVSVAMLTEGWDANTVTHIFGLRAFGSQLLCEQVVGRGLRRMSYDVDPETGLFAPEYVDVYGIPFTIVPFKGRPSDAKAPEDKSVTHVRSLDERSHYLIEFPMVEGYAYASGHENVYCDVASMEETVLEPMKTPTSQFVAPALELDAGIGAPSNPFAVVEQSLDSYLASTHLQSVKFRLTQRIVDRMTADRTNERAGVKAARALKVRHILFPRVLGFVDQYLRTRVNYKDEDPRSVGLGVYADQIVDLFVNAIDVEGEGGEPPLLPKWKQRLGTRYVRFQTTRPCREATRSHLSHVVLDAPGWESSVAYRLEAAVDVVECYVRNDANLGLAIDYEYMGVDHKYIPDFIVRLKSGLHVILEVKGQKDARDAAKHQAAQKWVRAVNYAGGFGKWDFRVCYDPDMAIAELTRIQKAADLVLPYGKEPN